MAFPQGLIDRAIERAGQPVWLYPSSDPLASYTSMRGIFSEHTDTETVQGQDVKRRRPSVVVPSGKVEHVAVGDRLITGETEYVVERIDRARQGTRLFLAVGS